jgi:hypothetical protein
MFYLVPTVLVLFVSEIFFEIPKSVIFAVKSKVNKTLSVFKSLWITPLS